MMEVISMIDIRQWTVIIIWIEMNFQSSLYWHIIYILGDNQNVFPVSGKMGTNIQPLLVFIRKIYDESEETISNRNSCHIDQTIN